MYLEEVTTIQRDAWCGKHLFEMRLIRAYQTPGIL